MVRVGLIIHILLVRVSGPAGIVGPAHALAVNVQRSLSILNTTTEVSSSKTPSPQLLSGCRSTGCPLLWVCVHSVCAFTAVCVFTVCVRSLLCVCSRCVCVHCCVCSRCVCVFTVCVCVHGVCAFTAVCVFTVCVHVGWVNCRALIPSMGHHTWPNVTSQQCKTTYFINYKALVNQSTNKMLELKKLDFKE